MSRAPRPAIVAVDFDGVVNALPGDDGDLAHFRRWDRRRVMGFPLTVAGEVLDWVTTLEDRGGEFHWATTWTPNRHLLDTAFGLPERAPIAADPDAATPEAPLGVSWKGAQIMALVEEERRPLVWIDDDAITDATARALANQADRLELPMLAVVPARSTGLRPEDLAVVDAFLATLREGEPAAGLQVHHA